MLVFNSDVRLSACILLLGCASAYCFHLCACTRVTLTGRLRGQHSDFGSGYKLEGQRIPVPVVRLLQEIFPTLGEERREGKRRTAALAQPPVSALVGLRKR